MEVYPPVISNNAQSDINNKNKRILFVVDGDPAYLYYTGMLLQRLGYSIYTAKTAEETLEVMKFATPLLVLTEIALPHMNGVAFLQKIKQDPKTNRIPVIVYTALTDQALKYLCQDEGCAAFLKKPFDPDELYAAVQKATEVTPRRYARLHTCLSVVLGDGQAMKDSCITALSENGMYVSASKPLAIGVTVPIRMTVGNANIATQGVVLYSFGSGKGPLGIPGMGIKFLDIKHEDQVLISAFIKKELTRDLDEHPHGK